ncbi:hypothetical protein VTL71DRAFT_15388 [Oculimacula yallundae]|uniref:Uncharacterized protein n=1 Tax=Oculimacula yallundae TaxID=86028 RepID=A0ABR4CGG0_9HELO
MGSQPPHGPRRRLPGQQAYFAAASDLEQSEKDSPPSSPIHPTSRTSFPFSSLAILCRSHLKLTSSQLNSQLYSALPFPLIITTVKYPPNDLEILQSWRRTIHHRFSIHYSSCRLMRGSKAPKHKNFQEAKAKELSLSSVESLAVGGSLTLADKNDSNTNLNLSSTITSSRLVLSPSPSH